MKIAEINLPYIWHWTDKLGRHRYRFRRCGFPGVELPVDSDPASPEFQAAYHAALRGEKVADALAAVAARGGSGTIGAAVEHYLNSTTFLDGYSPSTQALRRPILKSFLQPGIGNLPLAKMDRGYIERWLETSATMVAKRTRLLAIKPFFAWAIDPMHLIASDPTKDVKVKAELKVKEFEGQHYTGHYTWTNEQIAKYCACYPLGTMERLAIELMLDFATRRGDAIVLGRQHVKQMVINGVLQTCLVYTQQKNRKRKPVTLTVPISPELGAAIEAYPGPETSLTFLTNKWGRPFTDSSFNDWFRERVAAAGCRISACRMGCARQALASWLRTTAPCTRSRRRPVTGR